MADQPILLLSPAEINRVFDVSAAIASQEAAFRSLGNATGTQPPRTLVSGPEHSVAFCYTNRLRPDSAAVTKFGSVNPRNADRGQPSISAVITVLDPITGQVCSVMDGVAVTTLRTSAASAVACRTLAVPDAATLAVIGSGVQAEAHIRAIVHAIDTVTTVRIWSPAAAELSALALRLRDVPSLTVTITANAEAAINNSQIVALCTTSRTPVIEADWVTEGMTVISIGSFAPDRCEVPGPLISRSRVVVDDIASAVTDAGPIINALREGNLELSAITSLGDILVGRSPGRQPADGVIYYNSVGVGTQDAAAAETILELARQQHIGTEIRW